MTRAPKAAKQSSIIRRGGFTNSCIVYTPGFTGGHNCNNPSGLAKTESKTVTISVIIFYIIDNKKVVLLGKKIKLRLKN